MRTPRVLCIGLLLSALILPAAWAQAPSNPSLASPSAPVGFTNSEKSANCINWANEHSKSGSAFWAVKIKTKMGYRLMAERYEGVCLALVGYESSGQPLVGWLGGKYINPSYGEDQGMFWLIPSLIRTFNINLDQGIDLFFVGIFASSFCLGILGFLLLFRHSFSRLIGVIGLSALYFVIWKVGDLYIFYAASAVAVVPLFLWLWKRTQWPRGLSIFLFLSGAAIGLCETARSHSATAAILFLLAVLIFGKEYLPKWRLIFCGALVLGAAIPIAAFHHTLVKRDAFLMAQNPGFPPAISHHVFWHSVYIGFGFLDNPYVPAYKDVVGFDKARSVDPNVLLLSPHYEGILRGQVWQLARAHPGFLLATVAAKIVIVIIVILACANAGLLAAFLYPADPLINTAFWIAICFDSLFGILIIPKVSYLLGTMAFAVLYGIFNVGGILDYGVPEISPRFKKEPIQTA